MKFATTLFTCVVVTLITVTEDASAGNRFSGKSSGRSSNRSFSSHRNRTSSMKNFSSKQNFRTPQTKKFTPKQNYQPKFNKTITKNSKYKGFPKTTNHKFTKDFKFTASQNKMKKPFIKRPVTTQKKDFAKIGKVNTKHNFKPLHKPDLHHKKHVKHKNFFHGHHNGHHNGHHGHHIGHNHWHRPWCHINVRPWCPPVCRTWYPVICEDPIIVPCQVISCEPVFFNQIGEAVVAAPANAEKVQPERLALIAGQQFQLTAQGLGNEQGMVIIEINEMGLPAKIEKWEDTKLGFQTPQIGLGKATEAKMHIMNKKGQLLATLDVDLLPEQGSKGNQVVAN